MLWTASHIDDLSGSKTLSSSMSQSLRRPTRILRWSEVLVSVIHFDSTPAQTSERKAPSTIGLVQKKCTMISIAVADAVNDEPLYPASERLCANFTNSATRLSMASP